MTSNSTTNAVQEHSMTKIFSHNQQQIITQLDQNANYIEKESKESEDVQPILLCGSTSTRPPPSGPTHFQRSPWLAAHPGWRSDGSQGQQDHRRSNRWCSAPPSHSGQLSNHGGQTAAHTWGGWVCFLELEGKHSVAMLLHWIFIALSTWLIYVILQKYLHTNSKYSQLSINTS